MVSSPRTNDNAQAIIPTISMTSPPTGIDFFRCLFTLQRTELLDTEAKDLTLRSFILRFHRLAGTWTI